MAQFDMADAVQRIQKARSFHVIRWRSYAQGFVAGVAATEDKAPVGHADCEFGKWYYGEGAKQLGHLPAFHDISGPHEELHATYAELFDLAKKGKAANAQERLGDLVAVSRSLLELLDKLEKQVQSGA